MRNSSNRRSKNGLWKNWWPLAFVKYSAIDRGYSLCYIKKAQRDGERRIKGKWNRCREIKNRRSHGKCVTSQWHVRKFKILAVVKEISKIWQRIKYRNIFPFGTLITISNDTQRKKKKNASQGKNNVINIIKITKHSRSLWIERKYVFLCFLNVFRMYFNFCCHSFVNFLNLHRRIF